MHYIFRRHLTPPPLLCEPFTLYPFHLSLPFTSLSLSPLYPFHLSLISPSLSISLLLSLFSLSFSLPYLMDVFVLVYLKWSIKIPLLQTHILKILTLNHLNFTTANLMIKYYFLINNLWYKSIYTSLYSTLFIISKIKLTNMDSDPSNKKIFT